MWFLRFSPLFLFWLYGGVCNGLVGMGHQEWSSTYWEQEESHRMQREVEKGILSVGDTNWHANHTSSSAMTVCCGLCHQCVSWALFEEFNSHICRKHHKIINAFTFPGYRWYPPLGLWIFWWRFSKELWWTKDDANDFDSERFNISAPLAFHRRPTVHF